MAASSSRNEYAEPVFGMNDASGVFAAWTGTMGIAAAIKGTDGLNIVNEFADCIRRSWNVYATHVYMNFNLPEFANRADKIKIYEILVCFILNY